MVFQSEVGHVQLLGNNETLTIDATDWATIQHILKLSQIRDIKATNILGLSRFLDQKIVLKVKNRDVLAIEHGSLTSIKITESMKLAFYRLLS